MFRIAIKSATAALAARGVSRPAFAGRCIPRGGVAARSNTGRILTRRAWPGGRIARLGATADFHHGLLGRRQGASRSPFVTGPFRETSNA